MSALLESIASELVSVKLALSRDCGNFIEARDQNGCLYIADVIGGSYVRGTVRKTW